MNDIQQTAKCFICGSGPEGLTRHQGKKVVSVCDFRGDAQCPKCSKANCIFIHDDVVDSEVWRVCGYCDYIEHIG